MLVLGGEGGSLRVGRSRREVTATCLKMVWSKSGPGSVQLGANGNCKSARHALTRHGQKGQWKSPIRVWQNPTEFKWLKASWLRDKISARKQHRLCCFYIDVSCGAVARCQQATCRHLLLLQSDIIPNHGANNCCYSGGLTRAERESITGAVMLWWK